MSGFSEMLAGGICRPLAEGAGFVEDVAKGFPVQPGSPLAFPREEPGESWIDVIEREMVENGNG